MTTNQQISILADELDHYVNVLYLLLTQVTWNSKPLSNDLYNKDKDDEEHYYNGDYS